MTWTSGSFLISTTGIAFEVKGLTRNGLGLDCRVEGSQKGRRPSIWVLTHIQSGHRVCIIKGDKAAVLPIATDFAELVDWKFIALDGWRNQEPQLYEKCQTIAERYPGIVEVGGGPAPDAAAAGRIAAAVASRGYA